jgi:hypothetical protein
MTPFARPSMLAFGASGAETCCRMLAGVALLIVAQAASDLGAAKARETAAARLAIAETIAKDPELLREIKAKNQSGESDAEIQKKDKLWQASPRYPLRKQLTSNACAARLKRIVASDPVIVEAFLMDAKGALVCASRETSDYWQGDEDKWLKTYKDGQRVFVDHPALDVSTNAYGVQLSMLISDGSAKVGALTLTLKVPR